MKLEGFPLLIIWKSLMGLKIPGGVCLDRTMDDFFCFVLQKHESAVATLFEDRVRGVEVTETASRWPQVTLL